MELLQELLDSWCSSALEHSWVLPDNHHVHVKVMKTIDKRIEIDELNHTTFTYRYQQNTPKERGLSNVANVIHSVDGWVLRSLVRRCSYDVAATEEVVKVIRDHLLNKSFNKQNPVLPNEAQLLVIDRWEKTRIVDVVAINTIYEHGPKGIPFPYLVKLKDILEAMLKHEPFDVICVHDEFKCHANHCNQMRYHYKEIMAELAEGTILDDILSTLYGMPVKYIKKSSDLADYIRKSNYGIC